jgi:hypothetical protein
MTHSLFQVIIMNMNQIAARMSSGFESSTGPTPEFKAFSSGFKSAMTKELKAVGATLEAFRRGHFECTGFYKLANGRLGYFSTSDVRGSITGNRLMFRSVANLKSSTSTSGGNQWTPIENGLGESLIKLR